MEIIMKMKNKLQIGFVTLMSVMVLTACGGNNEAEKESSKVSSQSGSAVIEKVDKLLDSSEDKKSESKTSSTSDEKKATKAATAVLDYLYKNKTANLKDVTGVAGTDMNRILEDTVYESKIKDYPGSGWGLEVDGSIYTAEDIFRQYSKVYIQGFKQIGDYEVKNVSVEDETATVTYMVNPIAMNSVSNSITWARANLYGGLEVSDMIGSSQNTDVKAINNLFTFKLYDIIYGDKGIPMDLLGEAIEIEFTLEKNGDGFDADSETILDLIKQSQVNEYSTTNSTSDQEDVLKDELNSEL